MATEQDILTFSMGETVQFTALLKNRDGTVLTDAASQTVELKIAQSAGGDSIHSFTSSPKVVLSDASTAAWTFTLLPTDLSSLIEGKLYRYEIWSANGDVNILQSEGRFWLRNSIGV